MWQQQWWANREQIQRAWRSSDAGGNRMRSCPLVQQRHHWMGWEGHSEGLVIRRNPPSVGQGVQAFSERQRALLCGYVRF